MPLVDKIADFTSKYNFSSEKELEVFFSHPKFIKECINKYKLDLPFIFSFTVNNELVICQPNLLKAGRPIDWEYFSGQIPITRDIIAKEENTEKRFALMMEFGINNFLKDIKKLNTNPSYGTLISATIELEAESYTQQFVVVRNGTKEPAENAEYLKSKNLLTEDGHRIYYIPVSNNVKTAKEGIEESWGLPEGTFKKTGWDMET